MGEGRTSKRRYTVAEAASALSTSAEAVRSRLKRGTLESVKEGGTVYVLLDTDQAPPEQRQDDAQTPDRTNLLIAEMQDRIRSLEEANRENRRIIAALTSRLPQIEAPSEAPGAPETATEAVHRDRPFTDEELPSSRPWWRRIF